jgi:hypothetical protein
LANRNTREGGKLTRQFFKGRSVTSAVVDDFLLDAIIDIYAEQVASAQEMESKGVIYRWICD